MDSKFKGKNHHRWKGDEVGYRALHNYLNNYKPTPESCEICGKITTKLDLCNISGVYNRDLDNYEYLCRSCHTTKDSLKNKETRGRKKLFNEPLTERITFLVTKKQNEKLNLVLENQTLDKSSFIRGLIFGFS